LPRYRGELLMTDHGVGCYSSQAAMKRWNRQNELLADAAERAAVLADWLGGATYPRAVLRRAWERFLWHQFHDDLTGTSIPQAYTFSWNDELISLNEFGAVLCDGIGAAARALDTRVKGIPLVVYNPLAMDREDIVEATVGFGQDPPAAVRVFDPTGEEVPAQIVAADTGSVRIAFLARVPSVGLSVYDVRPGPQETSPDTQLAVSPGRIENARYRVALSPAGEISSLYDKQAGRELLADPISLQLLDDSPRDWAAWEIDYDDIMAPPRTTVGGDVRVRVIERGPARVALEVVRECEGSRFVQEIRLAAGAAGDRVEVVNEIDWRTPATLLKAAFPLAVRSAEATYDLGLGTIQRGINRPELYEVPAQQWADLTGADDAYGVAVLSDCRYGWDRPDDHTLRLTLVHTPQVSSGWSWIDDQGTQDLGCHRVSFALSGHAGDWRAGRVCETAQRFNQPLLAFQAPEHAGDLGKEFALLHVRGIQADEDPPPVALRALKMAEESGEIIIRLQEMAGRMPCDVRVSFARGIVGLREVNGAEEPLGGRRGQRVAMPAARLVDGDLIATLAPYQPRAFALRLTPAPLRLTAPRTLPLALPFNVDGISRDSDRTDGDFDGQGCTLVGELLDEPILREGIPFVIGRDDPGWANVVACRGQSVALPPGEFNRIYLLAAAIDGDCAAHFELHGQRGRVGGATLWIQDYAEPIGQWDNRLAGNELLEDPAAITPGYLKPAAVGWVGTHRHSASGENEAYVFTHLFRYTIDVPRGARTLVLPDDERIRILAATIAKNANDDTGPAQPLCDRPTRTSVVIRTAAREFIDETSFALKSPNPGAVIHYTTDGSAPTRSSLLYRGPVTVRESVEIRARAFVPGMDDRFIATARFSKQVPRVAETVRGAEPGLVRYYYTGEWDVLPDFTALNRRRIDVAGQVMIPEFARAEDIGLVLIGYLEVPHDGMYRLHLWSDDGSALEIGAERIIDNDGLHGRRAVRADVALAAGMHPIRVSFFQHLGGAAFELWIEGPGIALQEVPAEMFWHVQELHGE
jgi:alpha-mannosidase